MSGRLRFAFFWSLLALAGANLVAPAIQFLASPVIARIYKPDAFANFFLQYSLAMVLAMLLSGFIYQGMISEKRTRSVKMLFSESILQAVCLWSLLQVGWALVFYLAPLSGVEQWLPVLALSITLGQVQTTYWARMGRIRLMVALTTSKVVLVVALQVALGVHWDATGPSLLVAAFAGELIFSLAPVAITLWKNGVALSPLRAAGFEITRGHLNFAKYILPSQLASFCVNLLPVVLLSTQQSAAAGFFAFSMRLAQSPVAALGNAIRAMYWRHIERRPSNMKSTTRRILIGGHIAALAVALTLISAPPSFFTLIFGVQWSGLEKVLPFVFIWSASSVLTIFPAEIVKHTNRQHLLLWVEVLGIITKATSALAWLIYEDVYLTAIAFCASAYLFNIAASALLLRVGDRPFLLEGIGSHDRIR